MSEYNAQFIINRLAKWRLNQHHSYVTPNCHPFAAEIDLFSVTREMYGIDHEVKCSLADFRLEIASSKPSRPQRDRWAKWAKHRALRTSFETRDDALERCPNFFYFVSEIGVIPSSEIPPYAGLIWFLPNCMDEGNLGFEIIARAPRLHTRPVPTKPLFRCARSLSFRAFRMDAT